MMGIVSRLILLPFVLSAFGAAENEAVAYPFVNPWLIAAEPQDWNDVILGYIDPAFSMPGMVYLPSLSPYEMPHLPPTQQPSREGVSSAELLKEVQDAPLREVRKVKQQMEGEWGSLNSQMVVPDYQTLLNWEEPLHSRQWQSEGAWRYTVYGPFSVFGQVGAGSDEAQKQDMKCAGKTGLACKVPIGVPQADLTLRSGSSVSYTDPLRPETMKERAEWLLEVEARWPLLAGIDLEYQGTALPAMNPLDRERMIQDLRLAVPVGSTGKFKLGAKRTWENLSDSRTVNDIMQLYMGLELTR